MGFGMNSETGLRVRDPCEGMRFSWHNDESTG